MCFSIKETSFHPTLVLLGHRTIKSGVINITFKKTFKRYPILIVNLFAVFISGRMTAIKMIKNPITMKLIKYVWQMGLP